MKKNSFFSCVLAVMMAAVMGIGLYACGSDGSIEGSTWKGKMSVAEFEDENEDGMVELTVTFTSEDSGNWSGIATDDRGKIETSESGTFQCRWLDDKKGTVTIRRKKGRDSLYGSFVIKGNKMQLIPDLDYLDELFDKEDHKEDYYDFVFTLTRQ